MLNLVLSLSLSHTGHWKFNMATHGKELSEDLKKIIVVVHKDVRYCTYTYIYIYIYRA